MSNRSSMSSASVFAVSLCLVLTACQSQPKVAPTTATLGAAANYLVCLHSAAVALDDHVSEVSAIAPAVADRCRPVFDAGVETLTRKMPPLEAAFFRHKAEHENLKLATAAVREERLEHEKHP